MKIRALWVLLLLALVASACGGDDDDGGSSSPIVADSGGEDPTPTPTDPPAEDDTGGGDADSGDTEADAGGDDGTAPVLTASARGVTPETITIGASLLDFEALVSSGLSPNGWGDQALIMQTYVDEVNSRGGINGRMLEMAIEFYNPTSADEAEAACLKLAGDIESFAVLGGFLGPVEPANSCITGQQNTMLIEGRQNEEQLAESNAPWYVPGANRDRRLDILLSLLDQEGKIEGRRIAIVGSTATVAETETAEVLLEERGNPAVLSVINDQPEGDIPAIDAFWQPLAERMKTENIDTVFLVGATTSGIRGTDLNGVEAEIWAVDQDALGSLGNSVTPEQADGVLTALGLSSIESWDDPTVAPCREIFAAANPDIEITGPADTGEGEEEWWTAIIAYCRRVALFELLATEAGPELTYDSIQAAADRLTDFELPGQPFNSYGPDKFDANDSWQLGVFDATASADGEIVGLGTGVVDVTP